MVTLMPDPGNRNNHESMTRREIARRLAILRDEEFGGEFDSEHPQGAHRYFVPADTLIGCERAAALGIRGEDDLFGAVVPHPFMAAKSITHPLVESEARAPEGWCHGFCEQVREAVLGIRCLSPR